MHHKDMLQVEVKLRTYLTLVRAVRYTLRPPSERAITKRKIHVASGNGSPFSLLAGLQDTFAEFNININNCIYTLSLT